MNTPEPGTYVHKSRRFRIRRVVVADMEVMPGHWVQMPPNLTEELIGMIASGRASRVEENPLDGLRAALADPDSDLRQALKGDSP